MSLARTLPLVLLAGVSTLTFGGGDTLEGKVESFSVSGNEFVFRFVQTEHRPSLVKGCSELRVTVRYERVPWYSWLPFVSTTHPSREQTEQAAAYLRAAQSEARPVILGYMGYGLRPVTEQCSFVTKGLALIHEGGRSFVLAFHDPV